MSLTIDVGIVGGGIAGSALALTLARRGVPVAVFEREAVFRDRIRGEAIHPWGVRDVDRLDLRDLILETARGHELPIWQMYRDREKQDPTIWADLFEDSPPELSVRHPELQESLIEAAAGAGARVFRPAEVVLGRGPEGPTITARQGETTTSITTRLVVGADGAHSMTRRWLGGTARRDPIHHYIGGTLVSGLELDRNAAHHASGEGGFAMIFPQTEGTFRVYLVCQPEERAAMQASGQRDAMMRAAARYFPEEQAFSWQEAGPSGFFPNADIVSSLIAGTDAVLIGDAAGANDPCLGHGLSLTFRDVRVLADLLTGDTAWEQVPVIFAAERERYFGVVHEHAKWMTLLTTEIGPEAEARRERVARAREIDPTAGGFAAIFALGPDGLVPNEAARRHFFGEDLD
jgi:2-polyprenyl-6-methoxyphenol hydroxylase-like FAD-dependent oxidoreductase